MDQKAGTLAWINNQPIYSGYKIITTINQVDQLAYSAYYDQINAGNIKTAVFNGQTDITGEFKQPVGSYTQYRVIQLPNGDPQLPQLLQSKGVTVSSQPWQVRLVSLSSLCPVQNLSRCWSA